MDIKKLCVILIFFLTACGVGGICDNFTPESTDNIKRNLSWANIDTNNDGVFEDYVSSIKLQPCSDCYIYAAAGLVETQYKIENKFEFSFDVSEQNIHNCMKIECNRRGDPAQTLNYIRDFGIQEELAVPTGDWGECSNCTGEDRPYLTFDNWEYLYHNGMNISREDQKKAIVNALQRGPVAVIVDAWWGLKRASGLTRYCVEPEKSSGHVVVIVGYRNYGDLMLVKNSHGEGGLLEVIFEGSRKCGFASAAYVISAPYIEWNKGEDYCYSTNDKDGDSVPDAWDNCPIHFNPEQENQDFDIFGDVCDPCPDKGYLGRYC